MTTHYPPLGYRAASPLCRATCLAAMAALVTGCETTSAPQPTGAALPAIASITISSAPTYLNVGVTITVTATVRDGNANPIGGQKVTWTSSDETIATVAGTGDLTATISARGIGTVTITAASLGRSGAVSLSVVPLGDKAVIYSASEGVVIIPMPAGVSQSHALAINDAGQVVGNMQVGTARRPFFWSRATGVIDLGTVPGSRVAAPNGYAAAINNAGEVAGWTSNDSYQVRPFKWTLSGGMVDLGVPPNSIHAFATAINDSGVVVGSVWRQNDLSNAAFRWSRASGMEVLPTKTGFGARANGINIAGVVAGAFVQGTAYDEEDALGTLWAANGSSVTFDACACLTATAVNSAGEIVGTSLAGRPFRWTPLKGLIELTGSGSAVAINDVGDVVGTDRGGGFFWSERNGVRVLIRPPVKAPAGINHSGQIVGTTN